jgi:hypothetical protein
MPAKKLREKTRASTSPLSQTSTTYARTEMTFYTLQQ